MPATILVAEDQSDIRELIAMNLRSAGYEVQTVAAGSGIGLSVVREIATQHGGRAWVEDAPGGGARFAVLLPRAEAPREDHEDTSTPGTALPSTNGRAPRSRAGV